MFSRIFSDTSPQGLIDERILERQLTEEELQAVFELLGNTLLSGLVFFFFFHNVVAFHPVKSVDLTALIQVCSETCILIYLQQSSHGKHFDTLDLGI